LQTLKYFGCFLSRAHIRIRVMITLGRETVNQFASSSRTPFRNCAKLSSKGRKLRKLCG